MDTNFNAALYQEEMLSLVNTAIKKLKAEHPDYEVFTMSLTTDFASGVSAVHFDSRASSERYLKKEAEQYQKYLQAGNLSMAEMYTLTGEIRIRKYDNPLLPIRLLHQRPGFLPNPESVGFYDQCIHCFQQGNLIVSSFYYYGFVYRYLLHSIPYLHPGR